MQTINNRYEFDPKTDEIGKGGFGRVFKAYDKLLRREVVLKFAEKGDLPDKYSLIEEISRVINFNHPNLVRYYDALVMNTIGDLGDEKEYQIGVMEYVAGGNLRVFLDTKPTKEDILVIVRGTLEGLAYLHRKGIIHRDIKPPNILIHREEGQIIPKICDFGISKIAGTEATLSNVIGTYEYMSPEQLGDHPENRIRTNADLWSIGVMMYEMLTGELPFGSRRNGSTDASIIGNILTKPIPDDINTLPAPFDQIVQKCLVREASARVQQAGELLDLLNGKVEPVTPETQSKTTEPSSSLVSSPPEPPVPEPEKPIEEPAPVREIIPEVKGKPDAPRNNPVAEPEALEPDSPLKKYYLMGGGVLVAILAIWGLFSWFSSAGEPLPILFQDENNLAFGYKDEAGTILIPPIYDTALVFQEDGRALVQQGNYEFYIDVAGNCVEGCEEAERGRQTEADQEAWQAAIDAGTIEAFRFYRRAYPEGAYYAVADSNIQRLVESEKEMEDAQNDQEAWAAAKRQNSLSAYRSYRKRYPEGTYASEAQRRISNMEAAQRDEKAWQRAVSANTIPYYQEYRRIYPGGKYAREAQNRMNTLQEKANQTLAAEKEKRAWDYAVKQNTTTAYQQFNQSYPKSSYVSNSRNRIKELEAKADEGAWQQATKLKTVAAYDAYLKQYPNGKYAATAKERSYKLQSISGQVLGQGNERIIGATIVIKGTTSGALTDLDGQFSLKLPSSNAEILVSYVGYRTQTIKVKRDQYYSIMLKEGR